MTDDFDDDRLLTLETKVAYQDKHIAELNDVIVELNRTVAELARRVAAVERLTNAEFGQREVLNEKPPHY
jgi:uncharacterized coiled-coil protein SlyX